MSIRRINDLPEGSGNLTNDDLFFFMDNPSGARSTRKISLGQIRADPPSDDVIYGRKNGQWIDIVTPISAPTLNLTGSDPTYPRNITLATPPKSIILSNGDLVSNKGKWIEGTWPNLSSSEYNDGKIVSLSSDVEGVVGTILNSIGSALNLTSISFANLKYVSGDLLFGTTLNSLTSIVLSSLLHIGGNASFVSSSLSSLNLSALLYAKYLAITANSLSSLTLSSLRSIDYFALTANSLTSLSLPTLQYISTSVSGNFSITSTSLSSLTLSSLNSIGSNLSTSLSLTTPSLQNLSLPTLGTWKTCGLSIYITNSALNQNSVDSLLASLAYMDGNNGTTSFGTSKTVNIGGGTSAPPSNQGSRTTNGSNFICSGTTCTVNLNNHGYSTGDVLRISGITTATNANRYTIINVINSNQFAYPITSQTATGSGTATIIKADNSVKALVTRGVTLTTN